MTVRREGPSSVSVANFTRISLFVQKLLGGSENFDIGDTWPRPRPLSGRFIFRTLEGSVLHLCTKCDADCSILSKVIKGVPKFGN